MNKSADDGTQIDMPEIPAVAAISDIADTDFNNRDMQRQVAAQKLVDAQTPGFQVEFDPDEAELFGAFREDALSEIEALESSIDQPEFTDGGQ